MSKHWMAVPAGNDYAVPLQVFQAQENTQKTRIVILPALGISASFYDPLAEALCALGYNLVVAEQRGHGQSSLRPSRKTNFGFKEILTQDIPLTLDWVENHLPGERVALLGHSLGGHFAAMSAALYPERIHALLLSACGSPWLQAYQGKTRRQIRLLMGLVRASNALLGYYPGDRLGFGGREARQVMNDWLQLAKYNRYAAHGLDADLDAALAHYCGAVLALRYDRDAFAPQAASRAVTQKFRDDLVTEQVISSEELGRKADHYAWVRQGHVAAQAIDQWLQSRDL